MPLFPQTDLLNTFVRPAPCLQQRLSNAALARHDPLSNIKWSTGFESLCLIRLVTSAPGALLQIFEHEFCSRAPKQQRRWLVAQLSGKLLNLVSWEYVVLLAGPHKIDLGAVVAAVVAAAARAAAAAVVAAAARAAARAASAAVAAAGPKEGAPKSIVLTGSTHNCSLVHLTDTADEGQGQLKAKASVLVLDKHQRFPWHELGLIRFPCAL
ncbi:hypothetical protein Efla_005404 [Eimeria flavescens]